MCLTSFAYNTLQAMDTADPNFRAFSYPARISESPGRLPPRGPHMNCKNMFSLKYSLFELQYPL